MTLKFLSPPPSKTGGATTACDASSAKPFAKTTPRKSRRLGAYRCLSARDRGHTGLRTFLAALFERYSKEAGKEQYLIPYFIAAHPGTSDQDMLELALWLKRHKLRADQVQAFLPGPMATATAMYHSGRNPLKRITRSSEEVLIPKGLKVRRLHKALLRYHDPNNWPLLREALRRMGRADLIGSGRHQLVPAYQPAGTGAGRTASAPFRTQHTGLPRPPRRARATRPGRAQSS